MLSADYSHVADFTRHMELVAALVEKRLPLGEESAALPIAVGADFTAAGR